MTVLIIAAIIGILWFYNKNFENKGHDAIESEDVDNMEDEDENEINVTTATI